MTKEKAFFQAFIVPARRQRYIDLLDAKSGRKKVLQSLDHFKDLDPRFCQRIVPAKQNPADIAGLLFAAGAPGVCRIMCSDPKLDGREMELSEALALVVGGGRGAVISSIPGRLAYFESEEPGERYICRRH